MHREDDPQEQVKRFRRAAQDGDATLVAELLAAGVEPDAREGRRPTARHRRDHHRGRGPGPLIDVLLEFGADLEDRSMKGETVLERVAGTPDPDTVRHLLARGAAPTPRCVFRARSGAHNRPESARVFEEIEEIILRAAFARR
ncbi:hypothetical protein [Streptomyces zaomyceticus]|uniref:hypothetical protein n=1 Tax=Streptomyces zaomyceticus TaxID=68286 RepID=UPI0037B5D6EB